MYINKKFFLKNSQGFTLIELIIAMFIIALLTVGLIRGTMVALNTAKANKEKTIAVAIANEKIEILKGMDYESIGLTDENPGWELLHPELSEDGYNIYYYSSWAGGQEGSYKQVMVSVSNTEMRVPVEVVTRLYPAPGISSGGEPGYPSPGNLLVAYDDGYGPQREIELVWDVPETEREIERYNVYRDSGLIGAALTELYLDHPGNDDEHTYYVTAVYDDETESLPSNSVTASTEPYYPSPQDLVIEGYSGSGSGRQVLLSWSIPETLYTILECRVYRDGLLVGSTESGTYQDQIGKNNYTYYVTIYYEGDVESDPGNSVTTEPEITYPPPQNLAIAGYSGRGNNRRVNLQWQAPDSPIAIVEYRIYRNSQHIGSTTDIDYSIKIGKNNYTFYVTALYEGDVESDPGNSVTTE